jgi:DNA-binding transcriptional LysR family regulator
MSVRQFAEAPQLAVRSSSGIQDDIDDELSRQGTRRTQVMVVPSYLVLPPLLETGDYLAVVAGQLADSFARSHRLAIVALPIALPPSTIRLYWHPRSNRDAGSAWLRRVIVEDVVD